MNFTEEQISDMLDNSYRNFHTTGFDYICLERSPQLTRKLYFLDGEASQLPEVVNPHDHRYAFRTTVLAGEMTDFRFELSDDGEVFNAFDYRTPLNGGDGFTFRGEERLRKYMNVQMSKGESLFTAQDNLHTISMRSDQTVIMLEQYEDLVPLDVPTSCWSPAQSSNRPDQLDTGLYEKFNIDQLIDRLKTIESLL